MDLCQCTTAKTRAFVTENSNVCPNCGKQILDESLYEEPKLPALEEDENENKPDMGDFFKLLKIFGSVKERAGENIKLKLPYFEEKYKQNIKVYFIKLKNYLETYKINKAESRIRLLMQVLDGSALDLYLTLSDDVQSDLPVLEQIFTQHFRPIKLDHVELRQFWLTEKSSKETISEFAVRLQKRADEILVPQETLRAVFLNALPSDFQKHVALQKVSGFQDTIASAMEFEKTTTLTSVDKQVLPVQERPSKDVEAITRVMNEFMTEIRMERKNREQTQSQAKAVN